MKLQKPTAIDEYLARLPPDQRSALQHVREVIRRAAPKAVECISYALPAFRLGTPLVAFGATSKHCAFYPMSAATVAAFEPELRDFSTSKGTIRFSPDHMLPDALLRKLVKARVNEINGRG